MRMSKSLLAATAALGFAAAASAAYAESSVTCTSEPKDKWMSEEAITAKLLESGFQSVRKLKLEGNGCYEAYVIDKSGSKAEVYLNPMTAEIVKQKTEGDDD